MPELAIVSLDGDKNKALQMIGQLSVDNPRLAILTISQDHQALLQSLQKGAKYFLTHPVVLEDLLGVLQRALGDLGQVASGTDSVHHSNMMRSASGSSQVVSVLGSRGGVGTTTVAVNLAATLACDPNHNSGLVDLDMSLGDADIALEVQGMDNISIADLARNIERLDMNFLKRALVRHEDTGLSILRHPLEIQDVGLVHEAHIERVLNLLKISFTHLVLDLGKSLSPTDMLAMRMSDTILLVAQLELSSLRNVVRILHFLGAEPGLAEKVRVVLNRVGADTVEEGISLKKAEEVVGRPIYWQIPNDAKAVIAARVAGAPLVKHNPKCRVQTSITGLAQALAGKVVQGGAAETKKSGWGLFARK